MGRVTRTGWVALVVECRCGRPWSPPVRLSAALLDRLVGCGLEANALLATTRCRHCGTIHRHTVAAALAKRPPL